MTRLRSVCRISVLDDVEQLIMVSHVLSGEVFGKGTAVRIVNISNGICRICDWLLTTVASAAPSSTMSW